MSTPSGALDLQIQAPFDAAALRRWLAARAVPGVEEVAGHQYRRVLTAAGGLATLDLELGPDRVVARLSSGDRPEARTAALRATRALVDADGDPEAVLAVLGHDPHLGPLVRANPGLRCPGTVDPDELAVRAVLGQQVSVLAARTLAERLARDLGEPLRQPDGALRRAFPTPAALATLTVEDLAMPRAAGASAHRPRGRAGERLRRPARRQRRCEERPARTAGHRSLDRGLRDDASARRPRRVPRRGSRTAPGRPRPRSAR